MPTTQYPITQYLANATGTPQEVWDACPDAEWLRLFADGSNDHRDEVRAVLAMAQRARDVRGVTQAPTGALEDGIDASTAVLELVGRWLDGERIPERTREHYRMIARNTRSVTFPHGHPKRKYALRSINCVCAVLEAAESTHAVPLAIGYAAMALSVNQPLAEADKEVAAIWREHFPTPPASWVAR
ncbi:MAG: hypothetical protein GY772_21770 [bacterium]|nr:hypothetical protein [bacterium]